MALPGAGQVAPMGGEIRVAATATFQAAPAMAASPSGALVAVWQQQNPATGSWDVFARLYDDGGNPLASEAQVNTTATAGCRRFPAVAMDAAGDFVVAWQSDQGPGGARVVLARLFSASGQPASGELQVSPATAGANTRPAVAMAPGGRFLVAWQNDGQDGSSLGIFAQAYTSSGIAAGGVVQVNQASAGAQHSPAVAFLATAGASDRFVVAWQSEGQTAGGAGAAGIFLRTFDLAGQALSNEAAVNLTATGSQTHPAVASDPSGNFVVAWEAGSAAGSAVTLRRFTALGAPLSGEIAVDPAAAGAQRNPAVAADALGSFVVGWDSPGDGSGTGVFSQAFDNRQAPVGGKVQLNQTTAGDQAAPALALSAGGLLWGAWQSQTPAGDAMEIDGRLAVLPPLGFFTLPPCRLVDTRNPNGPLAGPILASGQPRIFPLQAAGCAIPATAKALSLNITAVGSSGTGVLTAYPGDAPAPASYNTFFVTGETRANNAVIGLSRAGDGSLAVVASPPAGGAAFQVHLVIDLNGYFE